MYPHPFDAASASCDRNTSDQCCDLAIASLSSPDTFSASIRKDSNMTSSPPYVPQLRLFQDWLRQTRGLEFSSYAEFWKWSVNDVESFWMSLWGYCGIESGNPPGRVLADARMPGASWFPGTEVNYSREVFKHIADAERAGVPAIISDNEQGEVRILTWSELHRQVATFAVTLESLGVGRGDRVAAYMPNVPETIVAFLACASIGAIWSVCAPDMGTGAVLERFGQISPKVLIGAGSVRYAGKSVDRHHTLRELREKLPSVEHLILVDGPLPSNLENAISWEQAMTPGREPQSFEPAWVPFDHPLWIVYSSGTTGLPKPIVHGHGGMILGMRCVGLHLDLGPSYNLNSFGERFHWYSSTGWVMWNAQLSGLLSGTTVCIYDGSLNGTRERADWSVLWRLAAKHRVTFLGSGAAYYATCTKSGVAFADCGDLSALRALGSTGSPLAAEVQRDLSLRLDAARFDFGAEQPVWWSNISGGTDFCGAFIAGNRELAQTPGRMQCRVLGHAVEAWNDAGASLIDEVGELVCSQPVPSMPLYFWGDRDNERYRASYFDVYPGIWRHGDWLEVTQDGSCIIYGRSDATINRQGLRMGSSEIYRAVEPLPEVVDSMVVDLEWLGRESYMALFVVLSEGTALDSTLRESIENAIRTSLSPRFVPNEVFQVPAIPRTLSGKKLEVPIKKILLGAQVEQVVQRESMANPESLAWFTAFAGQRLEADPAARNIRERAKVGEVHFVRHPWLRA
jgi:acetoacetyl-CoA synthetase